MLFSLPQLLRRNAQLSVYLLTDCPYQWLSEKLIKINSILKSLSSGTRADGKLLVVNGKEIRILLYTYREEMAGERLLKIYFPFRPGFFDCTSENAIFKDSVGTFRIRDKWCHHVIFKIDNTCALLFNNFKPFRPQVLLYSWPNIIKHFNFLI